MVTDTIYAGTVSIIAMLVLNYFLFYRHGHEFMSAVGTLLTAFAAFVSMQSSGAVGTALPIFLLLIGLWQLINIKFLRS